VKYWSPSKSFQRKVQALKHSSKRSKLHKSYIFSALRRSDLIEKLTLSSTKLLNLWLLYCSQSFQYRGLPNWETKDKVMHVMLKNAVKLQNLLSHQCSSNRNSSPEYRRMINKWYFPKNRQMWRIFDQWC
jgi:hypothetical protein